ncbi:MAG: hypothetical protein CGW95_05755 [Phenylobacterium zucineum]|nr:MAG: hypothetical protein CGW95_05755 [Phenylobacterium zucineum]
MGAARLALGKKLACEITAVQLLKPIPNAARIIDDLKEIILVSAKEKRIRSTCVINNNPVILSPR